MNEIFHNIARGILVNQNGIVLCQVKDSDWYFLPGGHIEENELPAAALLRELQEELGPEQYDIKEYVGSFENSFNSKDILNKEINHVFKVGIDDNFTLQSKEPNLHFIQVPKDKISEYTILPNVLKELLKNID